MDDRAAMRLALDEAREALVHGDVPVGAVVLSPAGEVVGRGHNQRELISDPTAHAEVLALREAASAAQSWRLDGHTLVVTLEPCAMCAGAMVLARLPRLVYGTHDPKAGAGGSFMDLLNHPQLNHRVEVTGGVLAEECAKVIVDFFAGLRAQGQK